MRCVSRLPSAPPLTHPPQPGEHEDAEAEETAAASRRVRAPFSAIPLPALPHELHTPSLRRAVWRAHTAGYELARVAGELAGAVLTRPTVRRLLIRGSSPDAAGRGYDFEQSMLDDFEQSNTYLLTYLLAIRGRETAWLGVGLRAD